MLNGVLSDVAEIDAELKRLQSINGEVWYYRENPLMQPHPNATLVFDLILEKKLTVMLASKPDFSEYFDQRGQPWPRDQAKRREVAFAKIAKNINKLRLTGAALAFIIGLVVAIPRTMNYWQANDMLTNGITTDAVVVETNRWVHEDRKGRQFVDYTLAYEFTDKTPKPMSVPSTMSDWHPYRPM